MITFTSAEFNQQRYKAKNAACDDIVFITDKGKPTHVLMSIDEYRKITRSTQSIVDILAMDAGADIEFTPSVLKAPISKDLEV